MRVVVPLGCALLLACSQTPFREVELPPPAAAPSGDSAAAQAQGRLLHVSVATMESPRDIYQDYAGLFQEVGRRVGMGVAFEQRRTYREVNQLLATGKLDVALLCTGGYLDLIGRQPEAVEVLAVPIIGGVDTYQSLLVVSSTSDARSLEDLAGKRFAYTEELSLTGRAWIVQMLRRMRRTPDTFFGAIVFTGSHDRSLSAVARGVVDGAAVHSVVYRHAVKKDPSLTSRLRIIERSPEFGITPLVVSRRLPNELQVQLREVLLHLGDEPAGATALIGAGIDRFEAPSPGLFDSAAKVVEAAR